MASITAIRTAIVTTGLRGFFNSGDAGVGIDAGVDSGGVGSAEVASGEVEATPLGAIEADVATCKRWLLCCTATCRSEFDRRIRSLTGARALDASPASGKISVSTHTFRVRACIIRSELRTLPLARRSRSSSHVNGPSEPMGSRTWYVSVMVGDDTLGFVHPPRPSFTLSDSWRMSAENHHAAPCE